MNSDSYSCESIEDDGEGEGEGEGEEEEEKEPDFETNINDLIKQVHAYDALSNEDKIHSIDEYNTIIGNISSYEEQIEKYKEKLSEIEQEEQTQTKEKKNKKKVLYSKKNFVCDMELIVQIRNELEIQEHNIEGLLELYEKLVATEQRVKPYLESKKLEIIKL
ncbi:MAG: hypothetical protein Barrevirus8_8 [Barrevirus sp.]|uniref:Uncharacterized protein n=1 Tax=Barrevirus sp. TaxID=2487763 RepID=A0A3G4ZQ38_9VIRU|nr:MAG: hypothetical protein Barrevirus8_8 [Barrevirus sp.]